MILTDQNTLRVNAPWEVLAEQVVTRRDGLVSQTTWLLNLSKDSPRFAMLLDYFPASAGRRGSVFTPGERFQGELAFYPSREPLRAVLVQRTAAADPNALEWPTTAEALTADLTGPLLAEPWAQDVPVLLPAGRIALDDAGHAWWRSADRASSLPIAGHVEGLLCGTDLARTAAIWSGNRLTILAAQTSWGRIGIHG